MSSLQNVANISQAFEAAWQRGERPIIETFVSTSTKRTSDREKLLIELVHTELELRLKAGEAARVEEYIKRFPELAEPHETLLDLLVAEFDFRRRREGRVSLDEFQKRFPEFVDELEIAFQTTADKHFPKIPGYELREVLGHGGMGRVYKAWQPRLRRWVAIKVLNSLRNVEPQAIARFDREMAALGQTNHPNLVRAVDAAEFDGLHYLVMEYVSGHDAAWLSQRLGAWPIAEACEVIRQAVIGLQAAHEKNLVHRDIKPSNVMISDAGEVKVLDLGLALCRASEDDDQTNLTSTGIVMGTVDYMAPEQVEDSHNVDIRADLYGLGASLFKLLTGKAPFAAAGSQPKRLIATKNDPPPSILTLRSEIPESLAAIILRLLQKNPADRYASPIEVATALAVFCVGADLKAVVANRIPTVATGGLPLVVERNEDLQASSAAQKQEASASPYTTGQPPVVTDSPTSDIAPTSLEIAPQVRRASVRLLVAAIMLLIAVFVGAWQFNRRLIDAKPIAVVSQHTQLQAFPTTDADESLLNTQPIDWGKTWSGLDELDPAIIPAALRLAWHPKELVAILGEEQSRHWGPATRFAFSPDGKYLASGGPESRDVVRVWRTSDFREIGQLPVGQKPGSQVTAIDFFPDGSLLTIEVNGEASVWSVRDEGIKQRLNFQIESQVNPGVLSPTGRIVASTDYMRTEIWLTSIDGLQSKTVAKLNGPGIDGQTLMTLQFTANGQTLLACNRQGNFKLWNLTATPPSEIQSFSIHDAAEVAMSPDGKVLAYKRHRERSDARLHFWDIVAGKELDQKSLPSNAGPMAFSWSVNELADFSGYHLQVIHDPLGEQRSAVITDINTPTHLLSLAISQDGQFLAANSADGTRVRLWQRTGSDFAEVNPPASPQVIANAITFAPDGNRIGLHHAFLEYEKFQTWVTDSSKPQLARALTTTADPGKNLRPVAQFASDGDCDHAFESSTYFGEEWQSMKRPKKVTAISLSPPYHDRRACGHPDGFLSLEFRDPKHPDQIQHIEWPAHVGRVCRVLFSPDGKRLASLGDADHFVRVWDITVNPPKPTHEFLVVGAPTNSGDVDGRFQLAFSSDSTRLAFATESLWDWELAQPKPRKMALDQAIRMGHDCLAYSPDGKRLLIGGILPEPHSVVLWDIEKNQLDRGWKLPGAALSVAFAPDGRHFGWVNSNRTAYVLRIGVPPERDRQAPRDEPSAQRSDISRSDLKTHSTSAVRSTHRADRNGQARRPTLFGYENSISSTALVHKPDQLPGVKSWTLESRSHRGLITEMVFSPDDTQLATWGADDHTIRIWEIATGKLLRVLFAHDQTDRDSDQTVGLHWSADGKTLASASAIEGTICLWEIATGKLLRQRRGVREIEGLQARQIPRVQWSPDGKRLAYVVENVLIIDAETGAIEHPLWHTASQIDSVAWSPNGKQLAVRCNDRTVWIWNSLTGEKQFELRCSSETNDIVWSPGGERIAVSCVNDKSIQTWDTQAGVLLKTYSLSTALPQIHWSGDGARLFGVGADQSIGVRKWNSEAWDIIKMMPAILSHTWSHSGQNVAVSLKHGGLAVIDIAQKQELTLSATNTSTRNIHTDLSSTGFGLHNEQTVAFWNLETSQIESRIPCPSFGARSHDGKFFCLAQLNDVSIFETHTGNKIKTIKRQREKIEVAHGILWLPDNQTLAFHYPDELQIWNSKTGELQQKIPGDFEPWQQWMASDDGLVIAVLLQDQRCQIVSLSEGKVTATIPLDNPASHVSLSFDGKRLAVFHPHYAQLWDATTGKLLKSMSPVGGHLQFQPVNGSFSPMGDSLAISNLTNGVNAQRRSIELWSPDLSEKRRTLQGGPSTKVAWSSDGQTLMGWNRPQLTSWNTTTGEITKRWLWLDDNHAATISPTGHYIASPDSEEHLTYIVHLKTGEQLTLTAAEFSKRFGWKNDSAKVSKLSGAVDVLK